MSTFTNKVISVVAALSISLLVQAEDLPRTSPARVGISAQRLAVLDAGMQEEIDSGNKAGIVVLIAKDGKVAHQKAYGFANLATGQKMATDTLVRLYSMTKPVTSVALLTLFEQGKFQLNDPLDRYIPEMANLKVYAGQNADGSAKLEDLKRKPTILDVFRHTAGFSYGAVGTPEQVAAITATIGYGASLSLKHLVTEQLPAMPLLYQPGERWVYSFSHDVQAYLVEYFSGMAYADYVQKTILDPLKMQDSYFGVPPQVVNRYSANYGMGADGKLELVENQDGTSPTGSTNNYQRYGAIPFGGSGLSSPIMDYARFAQMLVNGGELDGARILGSKTVELMRSNMLPEVIGTRAPGTGYGLGVQVVVDVAASGKLGSEGMFGWAGAANTWVWMDPKENMVAIIFAQFMPTQIPFTDRWQTLVYQTLTE